MVTQIFRNNILNIKVWTKEEKQPIDMATSDCRKWDCIKMIENAISSKQPTRLFERAKIKFTITDYMMYGFADYCDSSKGIDFGDKVIVVYPKNPQLKLQLEMEQERKD